MPIKPKVKVDEVERRAFMPSEIAARNRFSSDKIYQAIRRGELKAFRPGGHGELRVLAEDEILWLRGQRTPEDEPALGVTEETKAGRASRRRKARERAAA